MYAVHQPFLMANTLAMEAEEVGPTVSARKHQNKSCKNKMVLVRFTTIKYCCDGYLGFV